MHRHCVRRLVEILHRVAVFAPILVGGGGELVVVRILVTIETGCELHFVNCVLAGRQMTFVALHLDMFPL